MRVLLDTNVVLDAMLQRAPWHAEADAIFRAAGHVRACRDTKKPPRNDFRYGCFSGNSYA